MSDTTEAMRAAPKYSLAEVAELLNGSATLDGVWYSERHPTETGAFWWRKHLKAALAHPAPAAPAVTDSTHTGAVPDAATLGAEVAAWTGGEYTAHRTDDGSPEQWCKTSVTRLGNAVKASLERRLAAQPSPERNDCEPFLWVSPEQAEAHVDSEHGGGKYLPARKTTLGKFTMPLYRHPPVAAERHYCERCGKRLGSALGAHTCTPPGDAADEWMPIETAPKDAKAIWVWFADLFGGMADTAQWEDNRRASKPKPYWTGIGERIYGVTAYRNGRPTHWRHLPPPPAAVTKTPEGGRHE